MTFRIIQYACGICGYVYGGKNTTEEDAKRWAEECEARGPMIEYPIGCMYGDNTKGAFYQNITLCVAENREMPTSSHMNVGSSWACRDTGYGDSLGESMCSGSSLSLGKGDGGLDPTQDNFKRMVKYLRSQMIDITVWDGEKPVSYATFMKRWREKKNETKSD